MKRALACDAGQWLNASDCVSYAPAVMVSHRGKRDVLRPIVQGWLYKQIAADLNITERTVKRYRTAIISKVAGRSVADPAQLGQVACALEEHLPTFPEGRESRPRAVATVPNHG